MTSLGRALATFTLGAGVAALIACGTPAEPCSATTCGGCCDASGACVGGATTTQCGSMGNCCAACATGQACELGTCRVQTNTGGGGGSTGGGSATGGGGGATRGGSGLGGGSATGGGSGSGRDCDAVAAAYCANCGGNCTAGSSPWQAAINYCTQNMTCEPEHFTCWAQTCDAQQCLSFCR